MYRVIVARGFGVGGAVLADAVLATVAGVEHLAGLQRLQAHAARPRARWRLACFSVVHRDTRVTTI